MKVRFLASAYGDLDRLHAFLHPKDPAAADRAIDVIYASALSLEDSPERGRQVGVFRDLIAPFGRGAYVVRYRVDKARNAIVITRIWHAREDR